MKLSSLLLNRKLENAHARIWSSLIMSNAEKRNIELLGEAREISSAMSTGKVWWKRNIELFLKQLKYWRFLKQLFGTRGMNTTSQQPVATETHRKIVPLMNNLLRMPSSALCPIYSITSRFEFLKRSAFRHHIRRRVTRLPRFVISLRKEERIDDSLPNACPSGDRRS